MSEAAGAVGQPHSIRLRPAAPRMPNSCKNDIPDKVDLVFPQGAPFREEWFESNAEYLCFRNMYVADGELKNQVHWPKLLDMINSHCNDIIGVDNTDRGTHPEQIRDAWERYVATVSIGGTTT